MLKAIFCSIAASSLDDGGSDGSAQPPIGLVSNGSNINIINYKDCEHFLVLMTRSILFLAISDVMLVNSVTKHYVRRWQP